MSGQVVEDSIVGNNREKTKIYWEEQMRKEQSEKNRAQSKYWNNNAPSSELIIQKMNAEIEELHRREKELKRKQRAEADDEEDVFSSNTSSVDEFENSDSPRLESGFYSNAGEDESIPSPELVREAFHALDSSLNENRSLTESPVTVEQEILSFTPETQRSEGILQVASPVQAEPEVAKEPESPQPTYTFQKETPIEREIRLARERDNEYKMMRRISSSTSNLSVSGMNELSSPPASPVTKDVKQPKATTRTFSTPTSTVNNEEKAVNTTTNTVTKPSNPRDIQYLMATERLKKEIQEAKMREEELKSRELNQSPPTPTTHKAYVPSYVEPVKSVVHRFEPLQQRQSKLSITTSFEETNDKTNEKSTERKNSINEEVKTEVQGLPVSFNEAQESPKPQESPKQQESPKPASAPQTETFYNTLTRPKFNSIERYLLKSSMKFRIGKNFQIPTAESVFEPQPTTVETPEEKPEEEVEEPVTPRRRLVRAQDKIDQELREMREREKEFALRRAFKSTPDLSQSQESQNDDEGERAQEKEKVVVYREKMNDKDAFLDAKERRRSALINQWEEKIQSGN